MEKEIHLQAVGNQILLNNTPVRFDFAALENVQYITKEFEVRDIGGFSAHRPVTTQEIRDFLHLFVPDFRGEVQENGAEGRELPSLRLKRYSAVKEILDKLAAEPEFDEKIDRKKYLMTVYARTIFFMRKYFEKAAKGEYSVPLSRAGRLLQELVDLSYDQRVHFLGCTTTSSEEDYLPFHATNCALLAIVFGGELGLDKRQLHDLGMSALIAPLGLTDVSEKVMYQPGRLSDDERSVIDRAPLRAAKRILIARGLDKTTMHRIVAAYESKVHYAVPQRTPDGKVRLITPRIPIGVFGRIIAIVDTYDALTSKRPFRDAYGPEIALALMSSELKYRFDPVLLRIFMKVMAIQPIKIMGKTESTLRIG